MSAMVLGYLGTSAAEDSTLAQIFVSRSYGALMQLIVTVIPVRYPSWMGAYAGYLSDGAMILRCVRGEYPVSRA